MPPYFLDTPTQSAGKYERARMTSIPTRAVWIVAQESPRGQGLRQTDLVCDEGLESVRDSPSTTLRGGRIWLIIAISSATCCLTMNLAARGAESFG